MLFLLHLLFEVFYLAIFIVRKYDTLPSFYHHDFDSIYMKDLVDWPLMTTKNIKFMTKQDHLLRNFITGMSSSEQPFFYKIYCNVFK